MKTFKKILMVLCVIIIAVGMFILGRQGLNYVDGYSQKLLLDTVQDYTIYAAVASAIILVYLVIRYNKQGAVKVAVTSILGVVGAIAFTLAVMAIIKMPTNRFFFPIMLVTYVSSLIVISSHFEENT